MWRGWAYIRWSARVCPSSPCSTSETLSPVECLIAVFERARASVVEMVEHSENVTTRHARTRARAHITIGLSYRCCCLRGDEQVTFVDHDAQWIKHRDRYRQTSLGVLALSHRPRTHISSLSDSDKRPEICPTPAFGVNHSNRILCRPEQGANPVVLMGQGDVMMPKRGNLSTFELALGLSVVATTPAASVS